MKIYILAILFIHCVHSSRYSLLISSLFLSFQAKYYHAADAETQDEFFEKYGREYWKGDIDEYDKKCKVSFESVLSFSINREKIVIGPSGRQHTA